MYDVDVAAELAPNPFTPDFGRRPALLVGREALLANARKSLAVGPDDLGFTRILLGQRGSGKTTVLAEIREQAAFSGLLVLSVDAATPGLLERISSCVADARERYESVDLSKPSGTPRDRRVSGITVGPVGVNWQDMPEQRPRWSLGYYLETLSKWAAEHGSAVLLTVDELHAGERDELRRLSADLQEITKVNELPLAFVGAGLPEMSYTILEDKKMTFFHRCSRDKVTSIVHDDAWRCLRLTVEESDGTVQDDALRVMAAAAADGLPYKLQSIGHHAWELSGSPEMPIDARCAAMAVELAVQDESEKVVSPMWYDLSDVDQSYLKALAEHGGECTPQDIARQVSDVSAKTLSRAEDRLLAAGHVSETAEGQLRLVGPLTPEAIQGFAARESRYDLGSVKPASPSPKRGALGACNAYMPRVKAKCVLAPGHKGRHRSRI